MPRSTVLLGAPSSIGIKPYPSGEARALDRTPGTLRRLELAARLGAADEGDVVPPPYRDFIRAPGAIRNEREMVEYSQSLAARVDAAARGGRFVLVLGGDCSIVLGCLLGARRSRHAPLGLAYVDAHADFATPVESRTGSAASMCLGLAVGRGASPLARLAGDSPLVRGRDVALVGRRDAAEPWYGQDSLAAEGVLDIPGDEARRIGYSRLAGRVLERVARPELGGFWIHVDADVLDPSVMPAVDSPAPGGPDFTELASLVEPLVRHPSALGMELTIFDPHLDPDGVGAARLVDLLVAVLSPPGPSAPKRPGISARFPAPGKDST